MLLELQWLIITRFKIKSGLHARHAITVPQLEHKSEGQYLQLVLSSYDLLGVGRCTCLLCVLVHRMVSLCSLFHKIQLAKSMDSNSVQNSGCAEIVAIRIWNKFLTLFAWTLGGSEYVRENTHLQCMKCPGRKLSTKFQKTTQNFHQLPPAGAVTVPASLPWFRNCLLLVDLWHCWGWKIQWKEAL